MIEFAQHLVFLNEAIYVRYLVLLNCFDGHMPLGQLILRLIHRPKSTLANFLFKEILIFYITMFSLQELSFLHNYVFIEPPINNYLLIPLIRQRLRQKHRIQIRIWQIWAAVITHSINVIISLITHIRPKEFHINLRHLSGVRLGESSCFDTRLEKIWLRYQIISPF